MLTDDLIRKNFTFQVYEVLDSSTHRYTSTTLKSSGSTVVASNVVVSTPSISSSTNFHSDQEIWVRALDTGKERKFEFSEFNIDVRPEHQLLCVWDKKELCLVKNLNTNQLHFTYDSECQFLKSNQIIRLSFLVWVLGVISWFFVLLAYQSENDSFYILKRFGLPDVARRGTLRNLAFFSGSILAVGFAQAGLGLLPENSYNPNHFLFWTTPGLWVLPAYFDAVRVSTKLKVILGESCEYLKRYVDLNF